MSEARWSRLQWLFHETERLEEVARRAFLARECAGDEALRTEVEELLALAADDSLVDRAAIAALARELTSTRAEIGSRIGPYRVLSELGRGGMGTVYLVERADGGFEQRAALKVLAGTIATSAAVERFLTERQILAQLEHPNIARLLDGGTTATGAPYFVMERVEGDPVDVYCDRRRIGIAARLELFLTICDAVQYAHRQLVIHRDLKPANILVTASGAPKLLDFGIAKLFGPLGRATRATRRGELPLTPEYASPEQILGGPVTTASDVYQLGLLLYQLLAGRSARSLDASTPDELRRSVRDTSPVRPSMAVLRSSGKAPAGASAAIATTTAAARGTTPARLARRLQGDLDTIVLEALRSEPEKRYPWVGSLAEDVKRHLEGLPIRARRERVLYRVGKFVGRHRAGVAAAGTAAAALVVAALTSSWGLLEARRAGAEARRQARAAEQVSTFLEGLFAEADPSRARGAEVTAREILDAGVRRISETLDDEPIVRAQVMHTMARSYWRLGELDEASRLATRAVAVRQSSLGADHPDTIASHSLLATTVLAAGRYAEAETLYRESLGRAARSLGDEDPMTLRIANNLGIAVWQQGRLEEAGRIERRTLSARRRILGDSHPETLTTMNNLAGVQWMQGDFEAAGKLYSEALELGTRVRGRDHPDTLNALHNLALTFAKLGRETESEELILEALAQRRRVLGEDHPRTLASMDGLAELYLQTGRTEAAEELLRTALGGRRRLLGAEHPESLSSLHNLGRAELALGRLATADERLREGLEVRTRVLGPDHPNTLQSLLAVGEVTVRRSGCAEASGLLLDAATRLAVHVGPGHPDTLRAQDELGRCREHSGP